MPNIESKRILPGTQLPGFSASGRTPMVEKREAVRTAAHVPVTVVFYDPLNDDFYKQSGIGVDTSRNGICIETSRRLEKGLPVLVRDGRLANRPATGSAVDLACHGEVRWCCRGHPTALRDTTFYAGISFYEPLKRKWH